MTAGGHRFHPTILREYDIRGVVGETLDVEDARAIGRSFGTIVSGSGGSRVAVGYDGRLTSLALAEALRDGLNIAGIDVLDIGRGPTPLLYFSQFHLNVDAGVMVTGSHNPPDHNGFKLMMGRKPFYGSAMQEIAKIAGEARYAIPSRSGRSGKAGIFDAYVARIAQDSRMERPLKVAWDPGNGAAGEAVVALVRHLPGEHHVLNAEIDGRFPNHHQDPTIPDNLVQLQETVRSRQCDLGFAFDGDGDRLGIVDGDGEIIWGDQILAILAREILVRLPGAAIIADVKSSQILFDEVVRHGGRPIMWKTGHAHIKDKMAAEGSPLAGEMSAHVFLADGYYGYDDALYVAVRFLNIAAATPGGTRALRLSLPKLCNTPEIRLECSETQKFALVSQVRDLLEREGAEFSDIDGVRVRRAEGWWLLRASNTQPLIVARAEACDQAGLRSLIADLNRCLASCGFTPVGAFLALYGKPITISGSSRGSAKPLMRLGDSI